MTFLIDFFEQKKIENFNPLQVILLLKTFNFYVKLNLEILNNKTRSYQAELIIIQC